MFQVLTHPQEVEKRLEGGNTLSEEEKTKGDAIVLILFKLLTATSINIFLFAGCSKIHPPWIVWTIISLNSIPALLPVYHQLYPSTSRPEAQKWQHSKEDAFDLVVFKTLGTVAGNLSTWIADSSAHSVWALMAISLSGLGMLLSLYAHFFPTAKRLPVAEDTKRG